MYLTDKEREWLKERAKLLLVWLKDRGHLKDVAIIILTVMCLTLALVGKFIKEQAVAPPPPQINYLEQFNKCMHVVEQCKQSADQVDVQIRAIFEATKKELCE